MRFILALLAFAAAPVIAGPIEDGYAAVQMGDYATAMSWSRKAAEQGDADAQFNIGLLYEKGHGVPSDPAMAMSWYRKAAEQGDASAQVNLGILYASGQGVPRDYIQAYMWWTLAAAQGESDAIKVRDQLAMKMSPAQVTEAKRLARDWKPKPAR